jgi:hypothetical protein
MEPNRKNAIIYILKKYSPVIKDYDNAVFLTSQEVYNILLQQGVDFDAKDPKYVVSNIMRCLKFVKITKRVDNVSKRGFWATPVYEPNLKEIIKDLDPYLRKELLQHLGIPDTEPNKPSVTLKTEREVLQHIYKNWGDYMRFMPLSYIKYHNEDPNGYTLSPQKRRGFIEHAGFVQCWVEDPEKQIDKTL